MPRLTTFNGIAINIYAKDHPPPHVHAYYGDSEAIFVIETGDILVGRFPAKQAEMVQGWLRENRAYVQARWDELNPPK